MPYQITAEAWTNARRMPPELKKRLRKALKQLSAGDSSGLNVKRLQPPTRSPPFYRLRIGGWRAIFQWDGDQIRVTHIFPRAEGYGWLERLG